MSVELCPVKYPFVTGTGLACINYPMGDNVLCHDHNQTLGVIQWAVKHDPLIMKLVESLKKEETKKASKKGA